MKLTIDFDGDETEIKNVKHYQQEGDHVNVEFYCKDSTEVRIEPGQVIGTPEYRDSNDVLAEMDLGEEWNNYGDMNPKLHGGLFAKWDGRMWKVVETLHPDNLPPEIVDDDEFWIQEDWIEPMDIWVNGNPERGYTDRFERELDSYSNSHQPTTPHDMDTLRSFIAQFSTNFAGNPRDYYEPLDKYGQVLDEKFGIKCEQMDNVRID